jgi:hypothetical protein
MAVRLYNRIQRGARKGPSIDEAIENAMKGTTLRLVEAEDFSEENDDKRQP